MISPFYQRTPATSFAKQRKLINSSGQPYFEQIKVIPVNIILVESYLLS